MNKFGHTCFIGQPNVGKSTLTNHYLTVPLAIESPRPQTTWYAVKGIINHPQGHQIILTDTPGIHQAMHRQQNQIMNRIAYSAVSQADVICHLITPKGWSEKDEFISKVIQDIPKKKILVINKVDQFKDQVLFPFIEKAQQNTCYDEVLSISAKDGLNCDLLLDSISAYLPEQPLGFNRKHIHDHSTAFLAQEMIREQLMQQLKSEMPYTTNIEVFHTKQEERRLVIEVNLCVKHIGQKKIIIGHKGQQIKEIGQNSRKRLQLILKKRIMLKLWVKTQSSQSEHINFEY